MQQGRACRQRFRPTTTTTSPLDFLHHRCRSQARATACTDGQQFLGVPLKCTGAPAFFKAPKAGAAPLALLQWQLVPLPAACAAKGSACAARGGASTCCAGLACIAATGGAALCASVPALAGVQAEIKKAGATRVLLAKASTKDAGAGSTSKAGEADQEVGAAAAALCCLHRRSPADTHRRLLAPNALLQRYPLTTHCRPCMGPWALMSPDSRRGAASASFQSPPPCRPRWRAAGRAPTCAQRARRPASVAPLWSPPVPPTAQGSRRPCRAMWPRARECGCGSMVGRRAGAAAGGAAWQACLNSLMPVLPACCRCLADQAICTATDAAICTKGGGGQRWCCAGVARSAADGTTHCGCLPVGARPAEGAASDCCHPCLADDGTCADPKQCPECQAGSCKKRELWAKCRGTAPQHCSSIEL